MSDIVVDQALVRGASVGMLSAVPDGYSMTAFHSMNNGAKPRSSNMGSFSTSFLRAAATGLTAIAMHHENSSDEAIVEKAKSGLTPEEQQRSLDYIALILAQAQEPYKRLYLNAVDNVSFKHKTSDTFPGTNHDNEFFNYTNVDFYSDYADPNGPFYTLFHEMGHAIDDFAKPLGTVTDTYTVDGKTISSALGGDVRAHLESTIPSHSDQEQVEQIFPHATQVANRLAKHI